ncbi:MAG: STAS/SEC14 domain-containing protein [Alteromonadaceae bacterium]|nr:STAS/SEC14 domain-containing protein [Alteromonadaceae bacterium]
MLTIQLDANAGIATLTPQGELSEGDFESAAQVIDPYLEKHDLLNGIIIHVASFPGWETFASMLAHVKFVKAHHKKIACVAIVTDSLLGNVAEKIAGHFVNAEIKHFAFDEFETAKQWITNNPV